MIYVEESKLTTQRSPRPTNQRQNPSPPAPANRRSLFSTQDKIGTQGSLKIGPTVGTCYQLDSHYRDSHSVESNPKHVPNSVTHVNDHNLWSMPSIANQSTYIVQKKKHLVDSSERQPLQNRVNIQAPFLRGK